MQYANNKNGEKIEATPQVEAYCPGCSSKLIPKCGSVNIWHFAHKGEDCDPWYEPETKWHRDWKGCFSKEQQEVVMGKHRADVRLQNGTIIEFQNSPISTEEILEREAFYKKMVWVINAQDWDKKFVLRRKEDYQSFRWKHPRKSWWYATCPIYLDMGNGVLFRIQKIHKSIPCFGWGFIKTGIEFLKKCNSISIPSHFVEHDFIKSIWYEKTQAELIELQLKLNESYND